MRQPWRIGGPSLLGLVLLCAEAQAQSPKPADAGLDALYGCFRAATRAAEDLGPSLADSADEDLTGAAGDALASAAPVPFGPGTELFFFEQLGAAMRVHGSEIRPAWCETWFTSPYLRAHTALRGTLQTERHSPKLPLATGAHLASEARLIHLAARMGGVSHVSAHADMVRHAIARPKVARELTRLRLDACARGLLMQAAQLPDLYMFSAPTWHARSQEGAQAEAAAGEAAAEADRQAFVAQVVNAVQDGRAALRRGDTESGMVLLGAAAHAVQDLFFHRGITLAEQSGLTYVAHSNPDLPPDPAYGRITAAATAATVELLAKALSPLPKSAGAAGALSAENAAALAALVEQTWGDARPVSHEVLRRYFDLAGRYRGAHAASLAAANLGRWPVPATLDAVLAGL